jgi:hypothetical protein
MTNFHDNPFETDGGMHNVRVMRNMMINSASHAFCNQPSIGGPIYWIRNVAYHLPGGSTRLTGGSAGVLFYNNTILSETAAQGASNVHWRNNLFLGRELGAGHLQHQHLHKLLVIGLQRFQAQPGCRRCVSVELAAVHPGSGLQRPDRRSPRRRPWRCRSRTRRCPGRWARRPGREADRHRVSDVRQSG